MNICVDMHATFLRNVVIYLKFLDSFHLCCDSDAIFFTNEITCSVAGNLLRYFHHGLRVYLNNRTFSPPVTIRKLEIVFTLLPLMRAIFLNEYARVRLEIFKRRNFVLPRDHGKTVQSTEGWGIICKSDARK